MNSNNILPVIVAGAIGFVVYQNWPTIQAATAGAGITVPGIVEMLIPGMRLDPGARDGIDDRRGLPSELGPQDASFPGSGYGYPGGYSPRGGNTCCRCRRPDGGGYAQDGGPPSMPPQPGPDGDDYQGCYGGPPMPQRAETAGQAGAGSAHGRGYGDWRPGMPIYECGGHCYHQPRGGHCHTWRTKAAPPGYSPSARDFEPGSWGDRR